MILTKEGYNKDIIIKSVAQIEAECFSDPWTMRSVEAQLDAEGTVFACCTDNDGNIAGYVCGQIAADECELYRIAVTDSFRGRGYAKELMEYFISRCKENRITAVFLEVRSSNAPARRLYEKYGFQNIATRKNYYSAPAEDAVIYKREM